MWSRDSCKDFLIGDAVNEELVVGDIPEILTHWILGIEKVSLARHQSEDHHY
jgi:hypothetical protein